jgi:hypothetical protein
MGAMPCWRWGLASLELLVPIIPNTIITIVHKAASTEVSGPGLRAEAPVRASAKPVPGEWALVERAAAQRALVERAALQRGPVERTAAEAEWVRVEQAQPEQVQAAVERLTVEEPETGRPVAKEGRAVARAREAEAA